MGRIVNGILLLAFMTSCMGKTDSEKNAGKYGRDFNETRKANGIDTLPDDWTLVRNPGGYDLNGLQWVNPLFDSLLGDQTPFYGKKTIDLHRDYISETNYYYTGQMGSVNYGDKVETEPQAIEQNIEYGLDGSIRKISYSDRALDSVPCYDYEDHYEELIKKFRDGKAVPLCPDTIRRPKIIYGVQ